MLEKLDLQKREPTSSTKTFMLSNYLDMLTSSGHITLCQLLSFTAKKSDPVIFLRYWKNLMAWLTLCPDILAWSNFSIQGSYQIWRNFKGIWQFFHGLFSVWHNFEPTCAKNYCKKWPNISQIMYPSGQTDPNWIF